MNNDKQRILEELGSTQTVKDVQAAYNAICEADRQLAVRLKHARQDKERQEAEMETFVDDLQQITGLDPLKSRLFWKLFTLTVKARMRRRLMQHQETEEMEFNKYLNGGFPSGW